MRTAFLRTKYFWLLVTFFSALSSPALAELTITDNWVLQSKTRVSRTVFEYTYQVELTNTGEDVQEVTATVTSSDPSTTIVDGELSFGDVPAASTVTSMDTFSFRQNRRTPFDEESLTFLFDSHTVEGLDINGNGVRDDIDEFLLFTYGSDPETLTILQDIARGYQQSITQEFDEAGAVAHSNQQFFRMECLSKHISDERDHIRSVWARTINNPDRFNAYANYLQLTEVIRPLPTDEDAETYCLNNY